MTLHLWQKSTPILDANPPTGEELAWWAEARRPIRRRTFLRAAPVGVGAMIVPLLRSASAADPSASLLQMPVAVLIGAGAALAAGYMTWRATERLELQSQLAGRRIRARLLGDEDDDRPADESGPAERELRS